MDMGCSVAPACQSEVAKGGQRMCRGCRNEERNCRMRPSSQPAFFPLIRVTPRISPTETPELRLS
jgi:hypothetical protein